MFKSKIFESQIILKLLGARKPIKGVKHNSQNLLRSHMPEFNNDHNVHDLGTVN
jgi:hypothetical protein